MKFFDRFDRDPEDFVYLVLTQKQLDDISKKREDNKGYKSSLELVRVYDNQKPIVYHYKIKLKDLDVGDTYYSGIDDFFLAKRIE